MSSYIKQSLENLSHQSQGLRHEYKLLLLLLPLLPICYYYFQRRINRLRIASKDGHTSLPFSPTSLSPVDVILAFLIFIIKSVCSPASARFSKETTKFAPGDAVALPRVCVEAPLSPLGRRYSYFRNMSGVVDDTTTATTGSSSKDPLLTLVALSAPILPLVFIQPNCPIIPFGAVNTENRFEFLDPIACRSVADQDSKKKLRLRARFGGVEHPGLRTKRGLEFVVQIDILDVHSGRCLMRQFIYILKFLGRQTQTRRQGEETKHLGARGIEVSSTDGDKEPIKWSLASNSPRHWAACTLDYNPIHISYLASRYLFGFPGIIAHGNLVLASFFETLELRHKEREKNVDDSRLFLQDEGSFVAKVGRFSSSPVVVAVRFRRPVVVPACLTGRISGNGDTATSSTTVDFYRSQGFEILAKNKVCIQGEVSLI